MSERIEGTPSATASYTAPPPGPPSKRVGWITATASLSSAIWSSLGISPSICTRSLMPSDASDCSRPGKYAGSR